MIYLLGVVAFAVVAVACLWLFPMDRGEWSRRDQRAFEREAAKAGRP